MHTRKSNRTRDHTNQLSVSSINEKEDTFTLDTPESTVYFEEFLTALDVANIPYTIKDETDEEATVQWPDEYAYQVETIITALGMPLYDDDEQDYYEESTNNPLFTPVGTTPVKKEVKTRKPTNQLARLSRETQRAHANGSFPMATYTQTATQEAIHQILTGKATSEVIDEVLSRK